MHQGGVVEARVDNNAGNVELFVSQRLCGRADVILSQSNFEDLTDIVDERKAGKTMPVDCFNFLTAFWILTNRPRNGLLSKSTIRRAGWTHKRINLEVSPILQPISDGRR